MSLIEQARPEDKAKEQSYIPGVPGLVGDAMPPPELNGSIETGTHETVANNDGSVKMDDTALASATATSSVGATSQPQPQQQMVSGSLQAGDGDTIESDWIRLVQEAIRQTNGDPYTKQKRINILQAEYLKKRHNIDIEVES